MSVSFNSSLKFIDRCTEATRRGFRRALLVGIASVLLVAGPALAQGLPNPMNANVTGNYTVLYAKLSKPFRDQYSPEKLKEGFKAFADNHVDFDLIAAKPIVPTSEAQINDKGVLMLRCPYSKL